MLLLVEKKNKNQSLSQEFSRCELSSVEKEPSLYFSSSSFWFSSCPIFNLLLPSVSLFLVFFFLSLSLCDQRESQESSSSSWYQICFLVHNYLIEGSWSRVCSCLTKKKQIKNLFLIQFYPPFFVVGDFFLKSFQRVLIPFIFFIKIWGENIREREEVFFFS